MNSFEIDHSAVAFPAVNATSARLHLGLVGFNPLPGISMICPKCGNKPLSFASFLITLNPFRVNCVGCGAPLKAGPIAYAWMLVHVLIGIGLVQLYRSLVLNGVIVSMSGAIMYVIGVFGLLFVTAYVIPWMFMSGAYRATD